jgi:predicted transcriptional regulator
MLEKIKVISQIEITELSQIQVRESTRILENEKVLSESFNRYVLNPADDLTGQPAKVVALANALWTPEVVAKYQEVINQQVL